MAHLIPRSVLQALAIGLVAGALLLPAAWSSSAAAAPSILEPSEPSAPSAPSGAPKQPIQAEKPKGKFGRQILVLDKPILVPDYIFAERMADGSQQERAIVDFRGRVVVLNFWATWCGVCRRELPKLDVLAGKLPETGIDILALSLDEEMQVAASTLEKRGHRQLRIFQDSQSILSALLGVRGVPTTFVVGPDGYAIAMVQGPADWSSPEALEWLRSFVPKPKSTQTTHSANPAHPAPHSEITGLLE